MMRSLFSGVSGLKTHQVKMDVIGNNIANVNTVAYKSSSITFGELMYQTTQNASGPNALTGTAGTNARQIGLGVQAGAINTNIALGGSAQTTGNPFDLKISGDAFFVVSSGSSNYFTRAGAFFVDGGGNLAMTSNGYNVMGWGVDEATQKIQKGTVGPLRVMGPENQSYPPEATTEAFLAGIIDRNDPDIVSAAGKTVSIKIYDNLGYEYNAKISIKTLNADAGEYSTQLIDVVDADNKSVMDRFPGISMGTMQQYTTAKDLIGDGVTFPTPLTYNLGGTDQTLATLKDRPEDIDKMAKAFGFSTTKEFLDSYAGGTAATDKISARIAAGTFGAVVTPIDAVTKKGTLTVTGYTGEMIKYDQGGEKGAFIGVGGIAGSNSLTIRMNGGGAYNNFADVKVDLTTTTNVGNSGTATIAGKNGNVKEPTVGAGRKVGKLIDIEIQTNGMIYASYSNGQVKLLGQIAVAEFPNASGLKKEGDNLYSATLNSGDFDGVGVDITANEGSMTTQQLEMSNVDLSAEFTEMIITQRGFQANSRIITVSDTLLEELVNLKR